MSDNEIIELIKKDDQLGLTTLAQKYENLLFYIAKGILGNRIEDIEECVNDTYLKLWDNVGNYDVKKASLKTYLKIIVRNTAINKLRDLSRHEKNQIGDDVSEIAKYYIDKSQNVEREIDYKENIKRFNSIIKSLDSSEQELIIRKYFYLQPSKHIAKVMNTTVSAVDSKTSRTRKKIKKMLDTEEIIITERG